MFAKKISRSKKFLLLCKIKLFTYTHTYMHLAIKKLFKFFHPNIHVGFNPFLPQIIIKNILQAF